MSLKFTVHDSAGVILRTGVCSFNDVAGQAGPDETVVLGHPQTNDKVVDGAFVHDAELAARKQAAKDTKTQAGDRRQVELEDIADGRTNPTEAVKIIAKQMLGEE
jgi:hypothetical protein